ncbi:metal transporter [Sphingomonas melonis TY]|jgi:NodT family efflux transporter outer membrane factor (OMF) lipoprotein|uniref:Metal transporter n=1 Tax=Sphingomonas melonis TY TaxID=621456 RepID=A0A175Y1Y3_9SPHN|nr:MULTISPECIES: efflux transporter outer membrane subunit [Sphingomonas]AOW25148.1 metal transporter [Sphingomonas melonis TY]ATI57227.1 metal transporter [Sphingomonas melonis]KZB94794.1 metal transporter [Sphingomonas melonis TY]MBI0531778.1 efflux transporter outer membrane subunit [Sphingomonas sp. TX0522]MBX8844925.1 efflux transporter outer membrane subunit [Sphingomonas melonis]
MTRSLVILLACSTAACASTVHDLDAHAPLPAAATPATIAPATGPAQGFTTAPVAADWWTAFGSPQLNALVAEALARNNDIAVAEASLRQARELAGAAGGQALPQIDGSYQAERTRVSNALSPAVADQNQQLYTLHTAQVAVSYPVDLFGGVRSKIRSARAQAEVQRHRLDAARASVVANLVQAIVQRAVLADQVEAAQIAIAVNRDILKSQVQRQRLGAIGAADVATQQTALATAEGALPPLVRQEAHQRVVIAALLGRPAGDPLPALPTLASLQLPTSLPAVLPSDLVARRPDVRAAAAQLEGAGADVRTAIAARLPSITLSGTAGGSAQRFGDMFKDGNPFWTLIGGLTQPIFHAGALRHQQRAAEAALDGAKAQYRTAVLTAFGDVSDALTGLATDGVALDAATRASDASNRALTFARRQLALGGVDSLVLLNATAADAQARAQLVQAKGARLSDTVALFLASGGPVASR